MSGLARLRSPWIIVVTVVAAVLVNLAIYGIARLAGAEFWFTAPDGPLQVLPVVLGGFTAVPLTAGLIVAAIIGRWWDPLFIIAIVVATILEVGSIFALTIPADFDTGSTIALALCHLAMVPITVIALLALRVRARAWRARVREEGTTAPAMQGG